MRRIVFVVLGLLFLWIPASRDDMGGVNAQIGSVGIAISVPIAGDDTADASVICSSPVGYMLCDEDYSNSLFGVIADDPAVSFVGEDVANTRPVISSGNSLIRVNSLGGDIVIGDLITSSTTAGVGRKAELDGYVIGTALEDYSSTDPAAEGIILISMNIHPNIELSGARANLIQNLRAGLAVPVLNPLVSLRYIIAFAIVIIGFVLGFVYFGRVGQTGVEAIGRNPLAQKTIQMSILINISLGIVVVIGSLIIAALILLF